MSLCVCVYLCVCTCMHLCMHAVCVCICVNVSLCSVPICVCVHVSVHVYVCVCMRMSACSMPICACASVCAVHGSLCMCSCVHMSLCFYVFLHVCVCSHRPSTTSEHLSLRCQKFQVPDMEALQHPLPCGEGPPRISRQPQSPGEPHFQNPPPAELSRTK